MTAKRRAALLLLACAFGLLTWRLWPDSAQARRHQRDSALVSAVRQNDLSAATRLLDEGADPNGHLPPISLAQKIQIDYMDISHRVKAPSWKDMDKMDRHWSLLEVTAFWGNAGMTSVLLKNGADVGYRDREGSTASIIAAGMGGAPRNGCNYPRVLALLRAADARPHHPGNRP